MTCRHQSGFIEKCCGFQVVSTSPEFGPDRFHWAMLRLGDAELMLNTAYESDDLIDEPDF
jgi:glyoxylase I family protein